MRCTKTINSIICFHLDLPICYLKAPETNKQKKVEERNQQKLAKNNDKQAKKIKK